MDRRVNRRRFLKGAGAAGVFAAAPAVTVRSGWSQTGPIKIEALEPRSDPIKYTANKRCV